MAVLFHRRLAIPLWTMAFLAAALTSATPAALSLLLVLGIAVLAFTMSGLVRWLRTPRVISIPSDGDRQPTREAAVVVSGTSVRALDHRDRNFKDDALDLVRMDDDGGWQMARPPG